MLQRPCNRLRVSPQPSGVRVKPSRARKSLQQKTNIANRARICRKQSFAKRKVESIYKKVINPKAVKYNAMDK